MRTTAKLLLGLAAVVFTAGANAAIIDFGTSGGSNCAASGCSFSGGSVAVTPSSGSITQALFGLGINSGFADDGALDNYATGSSQEALTFTFNTAVTLNSFDLGLFEGFAEADNSFYTLDGGSAVSIDSSTMSVGQTVTTLVISTDPRPSGFFAIGNTTFRVNKLNVSEISPVPLPAAAWLFGSALLGLGLVKRRKA